MSASARPISPTRFAAALKDMPLAALYAKAAELHNAITHLRASNAQLAEFARAGDRECADALAENEETMERMRQRVLLIEREVEGARGMRWDPGMDVREPGEEVAANGAHRAGSGETRNGGLSDEELRTRLAARMAEEMFEDGEEGVFL